MLDNNSSIFGFMKITLEFDGVQHMSIPTRTVDLIPIPATSVLCGDITPSPED